MSKGAEIFTKRILVEISHAIERFARASNDGPMLVVAMFQRLAYFEREATMYGHLAEIADLVLVGVAEEFPPQLPDGVVHARLMPGEDLAGTWSVTVLTPRSGATLRCSDLQTVEPHSATLEAGRRFFGSWSMRRNDAYGEAVRLRDELAGRLDAEHAQTMDQVLDAVLRHPASTAEARADAAIQQLARWAQRAQRVRDGLVYRIEREEGRDRDPRSGLRTAGFVERFTAGSGGGTLPVALLLLRIHGVSHIKERFGMRAEMSTLRSVSEVLTGPLNPADHAVRLAGDDFLLLMPGRPTDDLNAVGDAIERGVAGLETVYPFVPLPVTSVATVTRNRPLPIPDLYDALARAARSSRVDAVATVDGGHR